MIAKSAARAIRPNAGIEAAYRKRLRLLLEEMRRSVEHWIEAAYRDNPPIAMDSPASDLDREMRRLSRQWRRRFNEAAPEIAALFARRARGGADATLLRMLKQAGFTVPFRMTKGMRDVVDATVAENVSLIRSIPEKYLGDVQTSVMQSVKAGRDLATLSKDLRKNYGVSYRRAALIARDQNNKATSALMRVRQVDLGLEKGVWLHSHAGKEPRPTHLANHGKKFDLKEGWFDPDPRVRKRILPGELINCRCVWKPVVPGLT